MKESIFPGIDNLLDNVLSVRKGDKILVAGDLERRDLVCELANQIERRAIPYHVVSVDYDGRQMPSELAVKLLDDEHNVVILFFGRSIWHQEARRIAKYEKKKRIVAYSGTLEMLKEGPALADPMKLKRMSDDIGKCIAGASRITLEGPLGTCLSGKCARIDFETGLYLNPGEGGNFPSGEAYSFGLIGETVEGFVHSNIKVKHLGVSADGNDAIFQVREGMIYPTTALPAERFFSLVNNNPELNYVAELAFGICPYDEVFDYSDSIQEEKLLGTAHVGLGADISFGGTRKGKHLDIVFGPATVTVNDKKVLINGKINPAYLSEESRSWLKEMGFLFNPKKSSSDG